MNIKINLERQDLINGLKEATKENIDYVTENYQSIVDNEIEMLEQMITEGDFNTASVINDNRGELTITNDKGEEIGYAGYYTDILV